MPDSEFTIRAAMDAGQAIRSSEQLDKSLGGVRDETKKVGEEAKKVQQQSSGSGGFLGITPDKLKQVGTELRNIGVGLSAAITAPLIGVATAALKVGDDFDKAFAVIRAGTGATGADLKGLEDSFRTVFANVPQDAQVVSGVIADLNTNLGVTGPTLETLAKQFLDLMELPLGFSGNVQTLTRVFGDWSIATENQSSRLDFMAKIAQETGIGIDDLATTVVNFGAPLRNLGFTFEEAAVLIGRFQKEGVNTETVMSGLRFALGKFAEAGVDAKQGFSQAVEAIKSAESPAKATALAFQIFGQRAANDMAAAVREGRFEIDDLVQAIEGSGDSIAKMDEDTKTLGDAWGEFKNQLSLAIEPLGRVIADILPQLLSALTPVIDAVKSAAFAFRDADPFVQKLILGFVALVAAVGPVLAIAGQLAISVAGLGPVMGLFATQTTAAGTAAATASIGVKTLSAAFLGPVGLTVALAGVVTAFYQYTQARIAAQEAVMGQDREIAALRQEINEYAKSLGLSVTQLNELDKVLDRNGKTNAEYKKQLIEVKKQLGGLGDETENVIKPTGNLSEGLNTVTAAAKKAADAVADQLAKALGVLRTKEQELIDTGNTLESMMNAVREGFNAGVVPLERLQGATQVYIEKIDSLIRGLDEVATQRTQDWIRANQDLVPSIQAVASAADLAVLEMINFGMSIDDLVVTGQQLGSTLSTNAKVGLDALATLPPAFNHVGTSGNTALKQVSTAVTDLGKNLADLIIKGGSLKDVFVSFGETLIRIASEQVMGFLIKQLGNLLGMIPGVGGVLGSIFGGGGGGGIGGAVGGAVSSGGGAAGGLGGLAGMAASGPLGLIAGFAQVGIGIAGLFQNSAMNENIQLLEEQSRRSAQFLGDRADGGVIGILFRILDALLYGTLVKVEEEIRNHVVIHTAVLEQMRDMMARGVTVSGVSGGAVQVAGSGGGAIEVKTGNEGLDLNLTGFNPENFAGGLPGAPPPTALQETMADWVRWVEFFPPAPPLANAEELARIADDWTDFSDSVPPPPPPDAVDDMREASEGWSDWAGELPPEPPPAMIAAVNQFFDSTQQAFLGLAAFSDNILAQFKPPGLPVEPLGINNIDPNRPKVRPTGPGTSFTGAFTPGLGAVIVPLEDLPQAQSGGFVLRGGLVRVHRNERITPAAHADNRSSVSIGTIQVTVGATGASARDIGQQVGRQVAEQVKEAMRYNRAGSRSKVRGVR